MAVTTFDPSEGPSAEQQAAEAAALAQGEKIAEAQAKDKAALYEQADQDAEDVALIGGKFKSQEDLLKAYQELQQKLGQPKEEGEEAPAEEQPEATEETPEEEAPEEELPDTVAYMEELGKEFNENGQLSEEAVEKLSGMDTKELIESYLAYQQRATQAAQAQTMKQAEVNQIMDSVGGAEVYSQMIGWAADNLPAEEIAQFNAVTNSNNPAAIKFAVEALSNRYKATEGFEAPLVTGQKSAPSKAKGFRSHAELSRAIADPRYSTDPAYRADVEERLARSQDLL